MNSIQSLKHFGIWTQLHWLLDLLNHGQFLQISLAFCSKYPEGGLRSISLNKVVKKITQPINIHWIAAFESFPNKSHNSLMESMSALN